MVKTLQKCLVGASCFTGTPLLVVVRVNVFVFFFLCAKVTKFLLKLFTTRAVFTHMHRIFFLLYFLKLYQG